MYRTAKVAKQCPACKSEKSRPVVIKGDAVRRCGECATLYYDISDSKAAVETPAQPTKKE